MPVISHKYLILIDKYGSIEFGRRLRRMPMKLRPRAVATRAQPAARAATVAAGAGRAKQRAAVQAGIPQDRVNANKMTMNSTIEGTPNAM